MKPSILNTIHLINMNGELLVEYLVLGNAEDDTIIPWVKCIPFFGMHELYRNEPGNPMVVYAGMIMPAQTFLGHIAQIMRATQKDAYPMEMSSQGEHYIRFRLTNPLSVKDIADLTQFPIEMIRMYYRDSIVITN